MALRIPYGLDPDETWEVDYVEASARRAIEGIGEHIATLTSAVEAERDPEKQKAMRATLEAAEKSRAALEADLAGYVPRTGPVFILGPIPNGKRAELLGESIEVGRVPGEKDRQVRDTAWSEDVVRWTVRGHRNLKSGKSGRDLPFSTEEVPFDGGKRAVVGRKTLEAYGRFIGELALIALWSQRLDEPGKNG